MDKNQLNKIKNIVEAKNMKKMMFTMEGNLCAARIREGRYRHNPPLTQEDLARKIQFYEALCVRKDIRELSSLPPFGAGLPRR